MRFSALKYALVYVVPLVAAASITAKSVWSFAGLAFAFGVLPALEMLLRPDPHNLDAMEEAFARDDRLYDVILYTLVPIQWGLLLLFLCHVSEPGLPWMAKLGMTSAFGMACGVLGINAGHELGHRPTEREQFMAKLMLLTTLYMHFFIEHNRGHHKNAGTVEDPVSSRRGEWLYAFFLRSISGSWLSAWRLERVRLQNRGLPVWCWQNEMVRCQVAHLALV